MNKPKKSKVWSRVDIEEFRASILALRFYEYIVHHGKGQRFMQALRNFLKVPFLIASENPAHCHIEGCKDSCSEEDTFFWEDKVLEKRIKSAGKKKSK